jgi:predicted dehydrogenase
MTLVGSKKMLVYDDVSLDAKIQIYDKGIAGLHDFLESPETFAEFQFQLRAGDLVIPSLHFGEPLQAECQHFIDCIREGQRPLTDGQSGLRVVKVLEAAEQSLRQDGQFIQLSTELSAAV